MCAICFLTNIQLTAQTSPIAIDDNQSVFQGTPAFFNVLNNDIVTSNPFDLTSFELVSQPTNGSLVLGSDGQVTYIPNGAFTGTDNFTYKICDTGNPALCDNADVFITVEENFIDPCAEAIKSHTYYMPFPANNLFNALRNASSCPDFLGNTMRTVISIKTPYPGVVITYDHWEDGFESDILNPTQGTSEIWGDGDLTNGIAPGYPNDLILSGGSIILDNNYGYNPRNSSTIAFDGRDKIFTTSDVAISEISGDTNGFAFQTVQTDVFDINRFGSSFIVAFGEDLGNEFQYTSLFIRASENDTEVTVDIDGDSVIDTTGVDVVANLNEGEVMFIDGGVFSGAQVLSTKPVGVDLVYGGLDCFGTRNINLLPGQFYGDTYYTPVPTTNTAAPAAVYLYNSMMDDLTINWTSFTSSGSFLLESGVTFKYVIPLGDSGYKLQSSNGKSYVAIEVIDSDADGAAFDWSFGLNSEARLTDFASVAWAPGSLDGTRNDNPVWVTAVDATTIYVKYDGALNDISSLTSPCGVPYDISYDVDALELVKLLDNSDNDQSGLAVFTCDNTKLAAVYGEDPSTALVGAPSLDVGTTIQPMCLNQLIFAKDDYVTALPNYIIPETESIIIDVLLNDNAFLTNIGSNSISIAGLQQPANGVAMVNSDGTITYTPNASFLGEDVFEYKVCSETNPNLCAIANVYITVTDCDAKPNENIINGFVYVEKVVDDGSFTDEDRIKGKVVVDMYADVNCNGAIDAGETVVQSVLTDVNGNYQFVTINGDNVKDDFEASTIPEGGNDGTVAWANNWQENGESNGFATPDVSIGTDGFFGNKLSLSGANKSASRDIVFNGANYASLYFDYRRESLNDAGEQLSVIFNGTTIFSIDDGNGTGTDIDYTTAPIISIPSANINANGINTLSFSTNSGTSADDIFYIDNIVLNFNSGEVCYITKVDITSTNASYSNALLNQQTISFTPIGTCGNQNPLGVIANLTANNDLENVIINTPKIIDLFANDIGQIDPASFVTNIPPANGIISANPDGTFTYTPNSGYVGGDSFIYEVCSIDDPGVCDVATVEIQIGCNVVDGQNSIFGGVFTDASNLGLLDPLEYFNLGGITVNLFEDTNGNGLIDDGSSVTTAITDVNGAYNFDTPFTDFNTNVRDEFSNNVATGNNGNSNWLTSWQEIGETDGFDRGDVRVRSNRLQVKDNDNGGDGAWRTANLTGASIATLTYDFEEDDLENSDFVSVYVTNIVNPDPSPGSTDWVLIATHDGFGSDDTGSESIDISTYISANTSIRILGSPGLGNSDRVYFDNIDITYNQTSFAPNFVVEIDTTTLQDDYLLTTSSILPVNFTDINQSICNINFGATASNLTTVKTLSSEDATPNEGDIVEFTITVTNDGPTDNSNVSLIDLLPVGFNYLGSNPSAGTYNEVSGIWGTFNIAKNTSETLVLTGSVAPGTSGSTITNITTAASGDFPDTNTTEDDLTESYYVNIGPEATDNESLANTGGVITQEVILEDDGDGVDNDQDGNVLIGSIDLDPSTLSTDKSLVISGEGTWTENGTGNVTFTPESGFTNDPTPIEYTITDNDDLVSNEALILVDYVPVSMDDLSIDNVAGTVVTLNIIDNDTGGDMVNPSTINLDPISVSNVTSTDTDMDGYIDEVTVMGEGVWSVENNGNITFTPETGFTGDPSSIAYTVEDDEGNASELANVSIEYINSTVAKNDINQTIVDVQVSGDVSTNDFDAEGDSQIVTELLGDTDGNGLIDNTLLLGIESAVIFGTNNTGTTIEAGTITMNMDGTYTYVPNNSFTGTVEILYVITDDNNDPLTDSAVLTIEVTGDNGAGMYSPFAQNDNGTMQLGMSITLSILSNDSDPDGIIDSTTVDLDANSITGATCNNTDIKGDCLEVSVPNEGIWSVDPFTGEVTFIPNLGFIGNPSSIVYSVDDNDGLSNSALISITTEDPLKNEMTAEDDANSGISGNQLLGNVLDNDIDPEDPNNLSLPSISMTLTMGPTSMDGSYGTIMTDVATTLYGDDPNNAGSYTAAGILTISADGSYIYDSALDFEGTISIPYQACDNEAINACRRATLYLTTYRLPDLTPGIVVDVATIDEGGLVNIVYNYTNLGPNVTNGSNIEFRIFKLNSFGSIRLTSIPPGWTLTEERNYFSLKSNEIIRVGVDERVSFGAVFQHDMDDENAIIELTTDIIFGSGGEKKITNNSDNQILQIN